MAPVAGFNAKITVNGTAYTCTRWSVRDTVADLDITNTEGATGSGAADAPGFESRIAGPAVAEVSITDASFDPTEDHFGSPYLIEADAYAAVRIYLNGVGAEYWDFPSLLITQVEQAGEAKGLEPVTFTGRTDGGYSLPV
jgi:hypothetical protein